MKRLLYLIAVLSLSVEMSAQDFSEWFEDNTLRLDYVFAGDSAKAEIFFEQAFKQQQWAGRKNRLSEMYQSGNGQVRVYEQGTDHVLYCNSFSTLFQEWQATEEATKVKKCFETSYLVPFPKKVVDVCITLTDFHNQVTAELRHTIDPNDILIRPIGSGKSSLAFDTLYAEGQRRYVESLSTYARQFLGRMNKPECDAIEGIPPSIAIEQKVIARNPRSTVGTSTEIYDYLRMLFARVGHTFSPISGVEVKKQSVEDVVDCMLAHPEGTRFLLLSPLYVHEGRTREQQLDIYAKEGFSRVEVDGELKNLPLDSPISDDAEVFLVIDRLMVRNDKQTVNRLMDSTRTALYEGNESCVLKPKPQIPNNNIFS